MPGVRGIHHVQVAAPAGCEAAARRYYGELLGLPEIAKPPALAVRGGCWFAAGEQELHVGVSERFRVAKKAHPAFELVSSQSLDVLAERLAAVGVEVIWSPDELPGRRRFFAEAMEADHAGAAAEPDTTECVRAGTRGTRRK